MQKALALCMTALLLLAGCLGTDDVEEVVEDTLEIVGCGDETSLTYVANVTNSSADLCVYENTLENTIVEFISLIDDGPDMDTLDTTVGYTMELSEVYVDMDDCYDWEYYNPDLVDESQPYNGCPDVVEENIHYMETIVVSPTGYKASMEHSIDGNTEHTEIIISGNELQYSFSNSTENYTVRMKHAGTFEDAMDELMSDDDDDMGGDDDDMWSDDGDMDNDEVDFDMDDGGEPTASDYTQYFNPLSATISDYATDETGFTFSGMLNIDDAPFSYLEIHTDSSFTVLGFTMEDTEEEDNWVEFMMISSGDTSTDETIALSALPYILIEMSDDGESDESGYGTDWESYYDGYCEWEGNPEDDERWSCKIEESDSDWEDWWYYCELHDGNWHCTDDYGQSSEYANSADNDRYTNGYDGGDDHGSDGDSDDWEDGSEDDEIHYYDTCTDEGDHYECWMDEWDHDNDGDYEESHGYDYEDCSEESNGTWMCFAGYANDHSGDEYHYYDDCDYDNGTDSYTCVTPEGGDGWSNCELESNGTWRCWHDYEVEDIYYCIPFVEHNSAGFSIFDNTSLDDSMCGMETPDDVYEFDNSTFTMPIHLSYEDCWMEDNETVCETGDIYYDVNTTMLWETAHENNYMDCDGDFDNNTSMCTEWLGNITQADGSAFLLVNDNQESLMMYQYDEATQSGLLAMVQSDYDDDDMDPVMIFNMFDANEDGEVNASEWAYFANQSEDGMTEDDWNGLLMMIEMFDEDNSSGLNFDEFTNMMENMDNMGEDDGDMDPEIMFNMFDADDNGEVTASEWSDFTNQTDDPMPAENFDLFAGMMDNYDDDDSGGLDFDEFVIFMEAMENMDDEDGYNEDISMFMVFGLLPLGGDLSDYSVELTVCDGDSLVDLVCEDTDHVFELSAIMYNSQEAAMVAVMTEPVVFIDSDETGTLTSGDFVMINNASLDSDSEWNFPRIYSSEANAYTDENPMMSMLPGFTGFIATIGLLGAALIRRE